MTPKQKDARNWARSYRCHGQPEAAARILMIHGTDEQEPTDGTDTHTPQAAETPNPQTA